MEIDAQKILLALQEVVKEYNFKPQEVFEVIKMWLKTAFRRDFLNKSKKINVEVVIAKEWKINFYKVLEIVDTEEEITNEDAQVLIEEGKTYKKDVEVGEKIFIDITPEKLAFTRIAAQAAAQTIKQQIKRIEKERFYTTFCEREWDILTWKIKFVSGDIVVIEVEETTVVLPLSGQIPNKAYREWEATKVLLKRIWKQWGDIALEITQTDIDFVKEIVVQNIPEIQAWVISLLKIVRIPWIKSKVLVKSNDETVDPVWTCIGHNWDRINKILGELDWERIDIVENNDNKEELIKKAFSPARIRKVEMDWDTAYVYADDDQKAILFWRKLSNLKLVAQLTGYKINIV